jgi:hypothetical protein
MPGGYPLGEMHPWGMNTTVLGLMLERRDAEQEQTRYRSEWTLRLIADPPLASARPSIVEPIDEGETLVSRHVLDSARPERR